MSISLPANSSSPKSENRTSPEKERFFFDRESRVNLAFSSANVLEIQNPGKRKRDKSISPLELETLNPSKRKRDGSISPIFLSKIESKKQAIEPLSLNKTNTIAKKLFSICSSSESSSFKKDKFIDSQQTVYERQEKENLYSGRDKAGNSDGSSYEGQRERDLRHEQGKMIDADEDIYEGQSVEDLDQDPAKLDSLRSSFHELQIVNPYD